MKSPVLVILSGGMDSTVLAHHIAQSETYRLIGCVSVNYGQKHRYELSMAKLTCRELNVSHFLLDLASLAGVIPTSSLTSSAPVPQGHYAEDSMKATVVPNRNMILIALAVAVGISHKAVHVAYGAHSGDHAIYPDCRPEFADALSKAVDLCDYQPPTLIRPFMDLTKAAIVALGLSYNVNFANTWTCYEGSRGSVHPKACGKCGTCVERLEAFALNSIEDPLEYDDREAWKSIIQHSGIQ